MNATAGQRRPFYDHIAELRNRLLIVVAFFVLFAILAYKYRLELIDEMQHPLGQPLFYGTPSGGFQLVMQVCVLFGFLGAMPSMAFHLVRFLEPAFARRTGQSQQIGLVLMSTLLLGAGLAFGYFFILPVALHFFISFSSQNVKPLITTDAYFGFVTAILATFGVLFQLPLLMLFINYFKPLKPKVLLSYFKWVIVGSFVLALVLPFTYDPLTQALMALPIILLYLVSIVLIAIINRPVRQKKLAPVQAPAQVIAPPPVPPVVLQPSISPRPKPRPKRPQTLDLRDRSTRL